MPPSIDIGGRRIFEKWRGEERIVTFDANGGTVNPDRKAVRIRQKYGDLPIPVREGYGFDGWDDLKGGIYVDAFVQLSGLELTARWITDAYTITYDANGGTIKEDYKNKYVVYLHSETIATDYGKNGQDKDVYDYLYEREGCTFKEWNTKADGTGTSYTEEQTINRSSNITLYAIWESETGTITYNSNYGTSQTETQEFTYNTDTKLDKNTFTRSGYTFKEWNTKADGTGTSYTDEQTINVFSDLTLYAIWENATGTITYNSNYGTSQTKTQEFTYNTDTKLDKNTFTRSGFGFKEWNTKADGTGTKYTDEQTINKSSDLTLYAIWEELYDYVINNYSVDETNKYISKIMVNTEVNMFTPNITLNYGYGIDVDTKEINNKRILYTGGKTRITKGLDLYREYTNIVIGDINGDGAINSADLLKIRQHLLGTNTLSGAYFLSSDINYDNTINSADLLRVRQHLLGTKPIE